MHVLLTATFSSWVYDVTQNELWYDAIYGWKKWKKDRIEITFIGALIHFH